MDELLQAISNHWATHADDEEKHKIFCSNVQRIIDCHIMFAKDANFDAPETEHNVFVVTLKSNRRPIFPTVFGPVESRWLFCTAEFKSGHWTALYSKT